MNFVPNSDLSFVDKSRIYNSLVALVNAEYPFDNAIQNRAAQFLESLEPDCYDPALSVRFVTDLVPSSAGSPSGFIESILALVSSPHSTVIAAAISFLFKTTKASSTEIRCYLVKSDLITNVLATVQPQTLQISENETIHHNLLGIIYSFIDLTDPWSLRKLGLTTAVDEYNHREMILQKVVISSSQFLTFLISNRYILKEWLISSFMILLTTLLRICPFHGPTLEFVLSSPIVMALSSCLSFVEHRDPLWNFQSIIDDSLRKWKKHGAEVVQSGKRMMQALFSEGFEDTLEQLLIFKGGDSDQAIVSFCHSISNFLGSNVTNL